MPSCRKNPGIPFSTILISLAIVLSLIVPPAINAKAAHVIAVKQARHRLKFKFNPGLLDFDDLSLAGKVLSIIYYPFFAVSLNLKDGPASMLVDAVNRRAARLVKGTGPDSLLDKISVPVKTGVKARTVGFMPFCCPNCGWDLDFLPDNKVHVCGKCNQAWSEKKGSYRKTKYRLVMPPPNFRMAFTYMPFWKIKPKTDNCL